LRGLNALAAGCERDILDHYTLMVWVSLKEPVAEDEIEPIDDEDADIIEWV
jgi:hypothetical protein